MMIDVNGNYLFLPDFQRLCFEQICLSSSANWFTLTLRTDELFENPSGNLRWSYIPNIYIHFKVLDRLTSPSILLKNQLCSRVRGFGKGSYY